MLTLHINLYYWRYSLPLKCLMASAIDVGWSKRLTDLTSAFAQSTIQRFQHNHNLKSLSLICTLFIIFSWCRLFSSIHRVRSKQMHASIFCLFFKLIIETELTRMANRLRNSVILLQIWSLLCTYGITYINWMLRNNNQTLSYCITGAGRNRTCESTDCTFYG